MGVDDLDTRVRLHIYRTFVDLAFPPTVDETAEALGRPVEDIEDAYRRLADGHVTVLKPDSLDVWMANPMSAVATPFLVEMPGKLLYGSCAWDAPGILAMLDSDGKVLTECPDCNEELIMEVRDGDLQPLEAIAHFAVPAARWWDDIGFT